MHPVRLFRYKENADDTGWIFVAENILPTISLGLRPISARYRKTFVHMCRVSERTDHRNRPTHGLTKHKFSLKSTPIKTGNVNKSQNSRCLLGWYRHRTRTKLENSKLRYIAYSHAENVFTAGEFHFSRVLFRVIATQLRNWFSCAARDHSSLA